MSPPVHLPTDVARDEQLAQLLAELTEELHRGRRPDIEAVARQHPDLAAELRELWAAVQIAAEFAGPALDSRATTDLPNRAEPAAGQPVSAPLPRSFGDYELLEEIGRGGMGVVYKARQRSLDRIVALKMVLRGDLASGPDLARFRAEPESAARLEHPHIVPVYERGEQDGQVYFTMKYVEGTTLARRLAAGPLPAAEAARYLVPVCRAVQHAHQCGIYHRDLKPSNVLIDRDGRPYVTDFGLAKRVEGGSSLTGTGAIIGTPSYMAPEQAAGSRGTLSPASDVYSLGAILYELLTGRPPFQAASAVDTLLLVLEQDPQPPRLLNRKVDRDLEMICLKCLQKPGDLRYSTAAELAGDLEAFLRGEPVAARSGSFGYVLSRLFRETHHAAVLENWGVLWMWHSLKILLLCALTALMAWLGTTGRVPFFTDYVPYLLLWGGGLVIWGVIFWALRRRAGPVTFIERQIAHVWAGGVSGSISVFVVELLMGEPVLTLSPLLAVIAAMVFLAKAGMLSGTFYFSAAACFLTAGIMALLMPVSPALAILLFGFVSAACFFFPGLKYHRQRLRTATR
jgi:serine/threonine-protein kinase